MYDADTIENTKVATHVTEKCWEGDCLLFGDSLVGVQACPEQHDAETVLFRHSEVV